MQAVPAAFDSHLVYDIIAGVVSVAWVVIGLLIRNVLAELKLGQVNSKVELLQQQQEVKDDLHAKHDEIVENQADLKRDFDAKHAQNTQTIAVHTAEDMQKFDAISRTLTRIDANVATLASQGRRRGN